MRFEIHRLDSCPSTNDAARELAAAGAPEGTVVVAEEQTAGRGTKGRFWHSPRGLGLYVSVLLRPAFAGLSLLPLAAGLAARDAVESSHGADALLRWPNDIMLGERKLGGVLCESTFLGDRPDHAILGVGLNVNHLPGDFPPSLRDSAVSLRIALGRPADPGRLLEALLAAIGERIAALARGESSRLVWDFGAASVYRPGDRVIIAASAAPEPFFYEGLDADGALLARGPAGVRRFLSAEVRKVL
jgi:BirA family biotin operon repressor/biotin-[acetyl-CoA-carboxylase] ligase